MEILTSDVDVVDFICISQVHGRYRGAAGWRTQCDRGPDAGSAGI